MKKKYMTYIGVALLVFGGAFLFINLQDMFQLRVSKTASVAEKDPSSPQITWERTEGPGTLSNTLATLTPGEKIKFCGKAEVSSNSPRPIYQGELHFEAYRGVTSTKPEECWGKRMYCGNEPCDSSDLIKEEKFSVGRLDAGEETREKCFTISPENQNLKLGTTYNTILYIYDESYSLDKCSSKPGGYPTLGFDYWKWDYSRQDPQVDITKTALSVTAISAGAALVLLPKF